MESVGTSIDRTERGVLKGGWFLLVRDIWSRARVLLVLYRPRFCISCWVATAHAFAGRRRLAVVGK